MFSNLIRSNTLLIRKSFTAINTRSFKQFHSISQQISSQMSTDTASTSSSITSIKQMTSAAQVVLRPSLERGHADHGWLDSYHTFSFASYYDPDFENFGCLRVINEDRVSPGKGFGKHGHRDAEIFSYIVKGALKHDDSLNHSELIKRGQVQFTSTGSGIAHAEMNGSNTELVHFLQIWVTPRRRGLTPQYKTSTFSDEDKLKKWVLIISPESDNNAEGSITIHADCRMYAGLLKHGEQREFVARPNTQLYIHVVSDTEGMHGLLSETALRLNDQQGQTMHSGDGAFVTFPDQSQSNSIVLTGVNNNAVDGQESNSSLKPVEVLIFELATTGSD